MNKTILLFLFESFLLITQDFICIKIRLTNVLRYYSLTKLFFFSNRIPVEPNSIESILCEAIKLEFEAYSCIPQSHSNSRELNDAERAKLNELIVANKALLTPLDDDINTLVGNEDKFKVILFNKNSFLCLNKHLTPELAPTKFWGRSGPSWCYKFNSFRDPASD